MCIGTAPESTMWNFPARKVVSPEDLRGDSVQITPDNLGLMSEHNSSFCSNWCRSFKGLKTRMIFRSTAWKVFILELFFELAWLLKLRRLFYWTSQGLLQVNGLVSEMLSQCLRVKPSLHKVPLMPHFPSIQAFKITLQWGFSPEKLSSLAEKPLEGCIKYLYVW